MGRKVKRLSEEQAREALAVVEESFKIFNSIFYLVHRNCPKTLRMPREYRKTWDQLQRFKILMELEVERACLG